MPALALPAHVLGGIPSRLNFLLWRTRRYALSPVKTFSTSFLVRIEDTPAMQALRDVPYVPSPPDNSLFESWSDEYTAVEVPTLRTGSQDTKHPDDVLRKLVSEEKFHEAELVRKELVESDVTIRPDGMYLNAAMNTLEQVHVEDRAKAFANWWSLLPSRRSGDSSRFDNIEQLIFGGETVDVSTVMQFGLISAEKGYYLQVWKKAIGLVVRFADPVVSADFIIKLVEADNRWRVSRGKARSRNRKGIWHVAVRTHCAAGRPLDAFWLIKMAHEYGLDMSTAALENVHANLKSKGYTEAASQLQSLFPGRVKALAPPAEVAPWPALDAGQPMRKNLRIVLWWLRNSSVKYPARASDIAQFFEIYKDEQEGKRFAQLLRIGAYKFSYRALSIVVHAEMLYHHQRQEFDTVLMLYKTFFHSGSVPADELNRTLSRQLDRVDVEPHSGMRSVPKASPEFPQKLWPTTYHSSLAWYAMVQLSEDDEEIHRLYTQLLAYVAQAQAQVEGTGASRPDTEVPRSSTLKPEDQNSMIAPSEMYDSGHFEPFLRRFSATMGPEYAEHRVFEDMRARGVEPSIYNFVTLAGAYAKAGREPETALKLLAHIEEMDASPTSEESFQRKQPREGGERSSGVHDRAARIRGQADAGARKGGGG
ncbi:hypothetical protein EVG20_g7556 [Dentipellis fragilis]|uniref:Pentacotripeptide-repeat region of PRORP domain-containing protein n=1 Tax=Dentipellis fragilis TaxID=205917 RepID=A0A4Y9YEC9_9AGAM|nr:hypothetical protein EVG20_g7556 [Dentipellis fragilis]